MARDPRTPDCSIKGCSRAVHKGALCSHHYAMVPHEMKWRAQVECMTVSHNAARKWHRKQLAYVRRLLASEAVAA